MKTICGSFLAVLLFGLGLNGAMALDKVAIRVQKKQDAVSMAKAADSNAFEAKGTDAFHYDFTIENPGLSELQQLTVSYVIFIERPKLGARPGEPVQVDRVAGSKTIDVVSNRAPQTVASDPFKLEKKDVVGGYSYTNGGRMKADDNVVGVWVRVSQNGQVIGELAQPSSVTKRGWEDKQPAKGKKASAS